jgi:Flp pilus assembly pilin Flp
MVGPEAVLTDPIGGLNMVRSNEQVVQQKAENLKKNERGASLVEYALLVALIAGAAVLAITTVGTNTATRFNNIATSISN